MERFDKEILFLFTVASTLITIIVLAPLLFWGLLQDLTALEVYVIGLYFGFIAFPFYFASIFLWLEKK